MQGITSQNLMTIAAASVPALAAPAFWVREPVERHWVRVRFPRTAASQQLQMLHDARMAGSATLWCHFRSDDKGPQWAGRKRRRVLGYMTKLSLN